MKELLKSWAFTAAFLVSGCAVGPNYVEPPTPTSAGGAFVTVTRATEPGRDAASTWWRLYDDPLLDQLVEEALRANTDVRVGLAHLDKVRAALRSARSDQLPQTTIGGSATRQRLPDYQVLPGGPQEFDSADLGFSTAYELDLFGRVRREVEAAHGDVDAADADLDAVRVTVAAETARAYLDALAAAERIKVAEETVRLLDSSIKVVRDRVAVGRDQQLDLLRFRALRDQEEASVSPLQADKDGALFRLAALLGRTPRDLPTAVGLAAALPHLATPIPVGDGMGLLERRPDVRAAERRLAAATARIGVATADLFPRIAIGGSVGSTSDSFSGAFGPGTLRFGVGPMVSWSFPNLASVHARIDASNADARAALATFDGAVFTALKETETALSAYNHALDEREALARARAEAAKAADATLVRQREGTIDFLSVLDAERTRADVDAQYAAAAGRVAGRQIDLFKALGGGWQDAGRLAAKPH